MSEYTISNSRPMVIVRRNGAGELVKVEPDQRRDYIVCPAGTFDFEVTGFAEPFTMTSEQYGESTKTRLECAIVGGPGNGKKCLFLYGWSMGPKSHLGKTYRKATGREVPSGEIDMADLLLPPSGEPLRFRATVTNSDKLDQYGHPLYADVVSDTVQPVGAERPAYDPFREG